LCSTGVTDATGGGGLGCVNGEGKQKGEDESCGFQRAEKTTCLHRVRRFEMNLSLAAALVYVVMVG
jgi:hypothetical protein